MYKKYFHLIALTMLIALSPSALTEGFSVSSPETQGLSSERLERLSALSKKIRKRRSRIRDRQPGLA